MRIIFDVIYIYQDYLMETYLETKTESMIINLGIYGLIYTCLGLD
jgi:hypothetical protein